MKFRNSVFILAALAVGASTASANLVANGDFETGDFTNWTLVADPSFTFVDTGFGNDATKVVWLGEAGGHGTLTQSIATNIGWTYEVSVDFAGDGDDPSFFSSTFGGVTGVSLNNPAFDLDFSTYTYNVLATSATSDLVFEFQDNPGFINMDNASVTVFATPEPAPFAVLGLGLLAVVRRRRKV